MITNTRNQIIDYISHHGQARVQDLHDTLKISKVAVHKQLKRLLQEGLVIRVGKPPVVFYTLKQQVLAEIKQKAIPILKEAGVTRSAIFGSYVRGEEMEDSDIDILVDLPKNATLIDLVGLKLALEKKLNKKVDIVEYAGMRPRIKDSILHSQYPIL